MEEGESLEVAVQRESLEELGIRIRVNDLYTKETSAKPETIGHEEYFFLCEIVGGKLGSGSGPEYESNNSHYHGEYILEWVDLFYLFQIDLRPNKVRDSLIFENRKIST